MKLPIIFLFASLIYAEEFFLNLNKYELATVKKNKSYCIYFKKNLKKFCRNYSLTYQELQNNNLKAYKKVLQIFINDFNKANPKQDIKDYDLKVDDLLSYQYYDNKEIKLFSINKNSFSIVINNNGYSGGAHGYYTTTYKNFTKKDAKEIFLKDLFIKNYEKKLKKIALKAYKNYRNLKPDQSLVDDCWFSNSFVLAKQFAITNKGLYFIYNPYEVTPYACGQRVFLIPYEKLKPIIKKDGVLSEFLKEKKSQNYFFFNDKIGYLKVTVKKIKKDYFKIFAKFITRGVNRKYYISISFPNFKTKRQISNLSYKNFKSVKFYESGAKIYNTRLRKNIKAKYLLLEGFKKGNYKDSFLSFYIKNPKKILIRVTALNKNNSNTMPDFLGAPGQQGYDNFVILF